MVPINYSWILSLRIPLHYEDYQTQRFLLLCVEIWIGWKLFGGLIGVKNMRFKLHKNIDDMRLYRNWKGASYHWIFFVSWNKVCYCRLNTWGSRHYGKLLNWRGTTATIKNKIACTGTHTKRRNCTCSTSRWYDRVLSFGRNFLTSFKITYKFLPQISCHVYSLNNKSVWVKYTTLWYSMRIMKRLWSTYRQIACSYGCLLWK